MSVILITVCFSSSPGARDFEIQTTDIISSDCGASQPPADRHCCPDVIVQESLESQRSSTESSSKDTQSHTATIIETKPLNHCTAQTDPSSSSPQQHHCGADTPAGLTTQNTSSFDSAPANPSYQAPSSPLHVSSTTDTHSQPGPLTSLTPNPSEAAALPSTVAQTVSQPQSQTPTQACGLTRHTSTQVVTSSPTEEPPRETPKAITSNTNATSVPASPTPATSSPTQTVSSSMEGSPVSDVPVPGFATLGRKLMLSGSEPHHLNHVQQHGPPHHHYPGMEHSAAVHTPALDANKRACYSAHTAQHHPSSCCNYSTISIPLPHPQPPLPEKRHPPAQSGSPSDGVGTLRPAVGHAPGSTTSTGQHQHHVTFSPTVGEIAPPAGQNGEASVESENVNRVSVKFVQDSSRLWYKPGISREQGKSEINFS